MFYEADTDVAVKHEPSSLMMQRVAPSRSSPNGCNVISATAQRGDTAGNGRWRNRQLQSQNLCRSLTPTDEFEQFRQSLLNFKRLRVRHLESPFATKSKSVRL